MERVKVPNTSHKIQYTIQPLLTCNYWIIALLEAITLVNESVLAPRSSAGSPMTAGSAPPNPALAPMYLFLSALSLAPSYYEK